MSVAPIGESAVNLYPVGPSLELVYSEGRQSREEFDVYFSLRERAIAESSVDDEEAVIIQEQAREWIASSSFLALPEDQADRVTMYSSFDENRVRSVLGGFINYLELSHPEIPEVEIEASRAFIDASFSMYVDSMPNAASDNNESRVIRPPLADADGAFAFIVPARMSRNNSEYGEEVEPVIPVLRYAPKELRAQMMLGLPPFVIDTYQYDDNGRRGYLILAPVFEDMREDIDSRLELIKLARANVNAAVNFAYSRFGVEVVGLGATLPSLTDYGRSIDNPHVITTTGHGGTAELIMSTIEKSSRECRPASVGILGLGAIGMSVAEVVADRYPSVPVNVFDPNLSKSTKLTKRWPDRFQVKSSDIELIDESQIIVSAIVGKVDLLNRRSESMKDKLVIDDSQPGSFDPEQVKSYGGSVLWVIGKDYQAKTAVRRGYDYATLLDQHTDVFGCEAETAAISAYMKELRERGMGEALTTRIAEKVAIKSAVDPQKARYISALFKKYGIGASQPQAFGKAVEV